MARNKLQICQECGQEYVSVQHNQIYCGSKTAKIGCSYKMHLKRVRAYTQSHYTEYMRAYSKKWHRLQRQLKTPYSERQRKSKREKAKSTHGRQVANAWRRKNIQKVLSWNRRRLLKKKAVEGAHSSEEWETLKKICDYKCVVCGISENELKQKWNKKGFDKLTRDHIIPISKGGTDYIQNIQPLCISCNAQKQAKEGGGING